MIRNQHIDSAISGRYTVPAPYKAGAGGRSPELHTAIYDAPASFLSSALTHARIMVGWAGEPKGSPVSVCAGTANPVQFTTHEFRSSGGGSYPLHTEAAIMATVPTSPYLKIEVVNGKAVIFSLHVACHFKRMHQNIVDKIEYPVVVRMRPLSPCSQRSFTGTARQKSGMNIPGLCWDIASVFRGTSCKEVIRRLLSSLVSGKGKPRMR